MTYNEKKSLYESIMMEVAKTVKRRLNENDFISKEDAERLARDIDKASRNDNWDDLFKKYPNLKKDIININEPIKLETDGNVQPDDSTLKDGWFIGTMIDESDNKIVYAIKGKTYDETMIYSSAFINSTLTNIQDLFINNSSKNIKEWKAWNKKSSNNMQNKVDEISERMYLSCVKGSKRITEVANKMKTIADKFGF